MSASATPVPGTTTRPDPAEAATDELGASTGDLRAPAERLRKAADLIEQTAAKATPCPWEPEYAYGNLARVQAVFVGCDATCQGVDCIDGTHGIGGFDLDGDNRWAILANPAIAAPLAQWLRAEADHAALFAALDEPAPGTVRVQLSTATEALALADVILGGDA